MSELSDSDRIWRAEGIGSSDASVIIGGKQKEWDRLIAEKLNPLHEFETRDVLLRKLGHAVETVCVDWFHQVVEKITGTHVRAEYPLDPWFRCMMDAETFDGLPVEAKFHSSDKTMDEMVVWYWPQLQHQMLVREVDRAWLAVIFGHYAKFQAVKVYRDSAWIDSYIAAAMTFKHYKETGEFLGSPLAANAPQVFSETPHVWTERSRDYNEVTSAAIDYITTIEEAARNMTAREKLKELMPKNVRLAVWRRGDDSLTITRNKAGAMTIKVT